MSSFITLTPHLLVCRKKFIFPSVYSETTSAKHSQSAEAHGVCTLKCKDGVTKVFSVYQEHLQVSTTCYMQYANVRLRLSSVCPPGQT